MAETTTGPRKMTADDYKGMYHFVCECGGSMAINGQLLDNAIFSNKAFRCPNRFYSKCNRVYSATQFKQMALFIPPPMRQE